MGAIVTTRYGKLEGEEIEKLSVFKGIPFAAPPVGALRWMPPQPPANWSGTRDARRFGPVSHQSSRNVGPLAALNIEGPRSEDCLYLNIWTAGLSGAKRPVMVWIHGGGFSIGAGSQNIYDGAVLARRGDTVVVTINYRLGPLGLLRLVDVTGGRIPSSGNEAILDQIAALKWVQDNIAEFGGDPSNVTIFGESAGGMSVGTLLAAPAARELFHKAIPQSGACHTASSIERANRVAERVLSTVGVAPADADAVRAADPAELMKGVLLPDGITPDPKLGMPYHPVVDGTILPKRGIEMVAGGSAAGVAVMAGTTLEEWKLFAIMDRGVAKLDREGLAARLGRRFSPQAADGLIAAYEKARASRGEPVTPGEIFTAIETDRVFRMPAIRLAEAQPGHDPRTYNYLFTWKSPAIGGMLGSCHALELGFVFGTNNLPGMSQFAGTGAVPERLATQMQDAWLAFARTGNPACDSIGEWPAFDKSTRATMIFGEEAGATKAPLDGERRAWEPLPDNTLGSV
ncbi:MAG TPA: carboxylesterase/lipase family protein [Candidatus Binataceae bacterium]|nr:carboxylesterase/lipase family protein [Candidatus Binataceae bacterium]